MAWDVYKALWVRVFGPNSNLAPTTDNLLVINSDGSVNVKGVSPASDSIATNQVSVDTTVGGKLIVAARAGRSSVAIVNLGTTDVYVGPQGLTIATGELLLGIKGACIMIEGGAAVFGVVAAGTQAVSYLEAF